MELDEALSQISQIRQHMANASVFRGYRAATAAFSGLVAVAAAFAQALWVETPHWNTRGYLTVWLAAALLCVGAAAIEMISSCIRSQSALQKEMALAAAEQFIPSLVSGALLTFVMVKYAYPEIWLLPGLWAILFSLGVFASRRVLPKPIAIVAGYYLLAGLLCIAITDNRSAFSPWTMGLIFAPGQFLAAAILWWTLERRGTQDSAQ